MMPCRSRCRKSAAENNCSGKQNTRCQPSAGPHSLSMVCWRYPYELTVIAPKVRQRRHVRRNHTFPRSVISPSLQLVDRHATDAGPEADAYS
jgi:hypothetical protein